MEARIRKSNMYLMISPGGESRQTWGEVTFEEVMAALEFSKCLVREIQLCGCVSSLCHC